jgi:hypothetical protein
VRQSGSAAANWHPLPRVQPDTADGADDEPF